MAMTISLTEYRERQKVTPQTAAALFETKSPADRARYLTIAAGFFTNTITEPVRGKEPDREKQRQIFCMIWDELPPEYRQAACDLINREERLYT